MKAQCDTCGNDYDRCMEVILDGRSFSFDCFECAIQTLAPVCAHCDCTIIGHGVEHHQQLYCCEHCSRHEPSNPTHPSKTAGHPTASHPTSTGQPMGPR